MSRPNPVPPQYDALIPYLVVHDGPKAMEFYKQLFGAEELTRMTYPGSERLMHAELKIRGHVLMLGDENKEYGVLSPKSLQGAPPVSIMIYVENVDALFAKATAMGCQVLMAPMDAFWGDRFGKFADPFGHQWAVATHIKDLTPEEMARGAQEWAESNK